MIAPLTMTVRDVLFVHWSVSPDIVRSRLPVPFTLETYDGKAWLGIVALWIEDFRPRSVPVGLSFPQINVRTYVTYEGESGVYFFTLDADDPLGVFSTIARLLFRLPYYRADIRVQRRDDSLTFRSYRTHRNAPALDFVATHGPRGDTFQAGDGSLPAYLIERYRLYVTDGRGRSYTGTIEHDPWSLQRGWIDIHRNDCFRANDLPQPDADPLVHYSDGTDFNIGIVRPISPD
jgi:uncharacterized protein YqjF (DUF2071 family)